MDNIYAEEISKYYGFSLEEIKQGIDKIISSEKDGEIVRVQSFKINLTIVITNLKFSSKHLDESFFRKNLFITYKELRDGFGFYVNLCDYFHKDDIFCESLRNFSIIRLLNYIDYELKNNLDLYIELNSYNEKLLLNTLIKEKNIKNKKGAL